MLIIGNPLQRPINHRALEPALDEMLELGINGLEVCTPHIELCVTPDLRRRFGDYVRNLGFKFCRYNSLLPDYLIELQSPDQVPSAIAGMKRDVDICCDLGINQLMTWEGKIPAGKLQQDIDGWILEETTRIFREGVAYAESKGVSVSLEVHPFSLGINVDWLCKLCDGVGSDTSTRSTSSASTSSISTSATATSKRPRFTIPLAKARWTSPRSSKHSRKSNSAAHSCSTCGCGPCPSRP